MVQTMLLVRGQKARLADIAPGPRFDAGLSYSHGGPGRLETCLLGLDQGMRLSDHRFLLHEPGRSTPDSAVRFLGPHGGDLAGFQVDLAALSPHVARLAFVAFIDGPGALNQLEHGHFRITAGGSERARLVFSGSDFSYEKAIIVAQLYLLGQEWRLSSDLQGFKEGIEAVFAHFGGQALFRQLTAPQPLGPPAPPGEAQEAREGPGHGPVPPPGGRVLH
jgi:stress response protein SCP2